MEGLNMKEGLLREIIEKTILQRVEGQLDFRTN